MRIKLEQFLYQNHSWSVVGWNIARALLNKGHEVSLYPTDKNKLCHLPDDLKQYESNNFEINYDMQISYTAMHNFSSYFRNGDKNKYAIWAYEFEHALPPNMTKYCSFIDKLLPPSNYCKNIFLQGKVPEDKLQMIPHGINLKDYDNKNKLKLKTDKKHKIGVIIGQPHARKNLGGMLKAYLNAFTAKDDVCLVIKINLQKNNDKVHSFYINYQELYKRIIRKYKNPAQIEMVTEFVPNMVEFYNAVDVVYTMTNAEGFYLPGLEGLACNKLNIAPRHGGQLDFLNDNNSLLVDGKITRAPREYLYWTHEPNATMFDPSIEAGSEALFKSYKEYDQLMNKFSPNIKETYLKYTWDNVVNQILEIK